MLTILLQNIYLFIILGFLFFLPGYFLLRALFVKKYPFTPLETLLISTASSLTIVDIIMLVLDRFSFPLNGFNICASVIFLIAIFVGVIRTINKDWNWKGFFGNNQKSYSLGKKHLLLVISIIAITVFIKASYLTDSVLPSSTDLGHHMYWSKLITVSHKLPIYQETDVDIESGKLETVPIADFIIGEHLPFAAIGIITERDFASSFPLSMLFLINILSVIAIYALALALFEKRKDGSNIALFSLLLIGPLFALSSPQEKFVSGGVVGNTIGNLLIPLIILLAHRAFAFKKPRIMALATFLGIGLAYTHHLSTFVFIFATLFFLAWFLLNNLKEARNNFKKIIHFFFSPSILISLALGIFMVSAIYVPTYLNTKAIGTAVGTPVKSTRTGYSFIQLASSSGEARMALGLTGLALLIIYKKRKEFSNSALIGWTVALLVMSLKPNLLFVDIPSNRIASYIIFPLTILGALALCEILALAKHPDLKKYLIRPSLVVSTFFFFASLVTMSGLYDNAQSLSSSDNSSQIIQTRSASQYLTDRTNTSDGIIKDHNYLAADSWIKIYFMRGYTYPLSRGYFKRYEDTVNPRENCTLNMISVPNKPEGIKCFESTNTDFVMINPKFDAPQFAKSPDFTPAYIADDIAVYYRNVEK